MKTTQLTQNLTQLNRFRFVNGGLAPLAAIARREAAG
jgi:hypothetical protein